jgi:hypothetical protein
VIPLYGFLEGDTIGLLVLAQPNDSADELAGKLQSAAAVRVRPLQKPVVLYRGQVLAGTVASNNMAALDRFDVREEPEPGSVREERG